jgi:hypothetical protein
MFDIYDNLLVLGDFKEKAVYVLCIRWWQKYENLSVSCGMAPVLL